MLIHLIYASEGVNIAEDDLNAILKSSNENNVARDITGILMYGDGQFIQVLEGPRDQVKSLYAKIEKDPRHQNTECLLEEEIEDRVFGQWAMAYSALSDDGIKNCGGNLGLSDAASLVKFMKEPKGYVGNFIVNSFKNMMA